MRILHCLRAPVGGLFRHVLDLAGEQARLGHDVGIVADSRTGDRLTDLKFSGIAPSLSLGVLRVPIPRQPGIGDLSAARAIAAQAQALAVDVLHGHGAKGGAYARLARGRLALTGKPPKVIYTPHGGSLHLSSGAVTARALLAIERGLERFSDGLIFESRFAADAYAARVGVPRVPTRIIHNGLAPSDFALVEADPDATDLLFIGELRDLKGVDVLLDAIAILKAETGGSATIVGAGPDEVKLRQQADSLGLNGSVRFMGAMPAREAFRLGRIVIVPSRKESFPYIVLEAAAGGAPLIATSVGGIPEIVNGSDTPLIPPGSPSALVSAIRSAIADPRETAARAARLRAGVQRRFTVEAMTANVLDFYGATAH